jgi:hypothetical protein
MAIEELKERDPGKTRKKPKRHIPSKSLASRSNEEPYSQHSFSRPNDKSAEMGRVPGGAQDSLMHLECCSKKKHSTDAAKDSASSLAIEADLGVSCHIVVFLEFEVTNAFEQPSAKVQSSLEFLGKAV